MPGTTTGAPTNFKVLERQWQVQETATVGDVTVMVHTGKAGF